MQKRKPSVTLRERSNRKLQICMQWPVCSVYSVCNIFSMQWPPKTEDLRVTHFKTPTLQNLFLTGRLTSNPEAVTDHITRLKLSFSQDLTYVGLYYPTFFIKKSGIHLCKNISDIKINESWCIALFGLNTPIKKFCIAHENKNFV